MRKRTAKTIAILLALVLSCALLPISSVADSVQENYIASNTEDMWALMTEVEANYLQDKTDSSVVVPVMLQAAYDNPYVDGKTIDNISDDGFSFYTTDGIYCTYSYRIRMASDVDSDFGLTRTITYKNGVETSTTRVQTSTSANVLLISPYYGKDENITDQYENLAKQLASELDGTYTLLAGSEATGPKICEIISDYGIIFFDGHGSSNDVTSYLCVTSGSGITNEDLSSQIATSYGGGIYGIDGSYIAKYMEGELSAPFIWMAICDGMKTDGLAKPLREKGAAVVFGYSQAVTFKSDYEYSKYFFERMLLGYNVADSAAYMKSSYMNYDILAIPYAYPVFVSDQDPYPQIPSSMQTVKSDWTLPFGNEFVSVTPLRLELEIDYSGKAVTNSSYNLGVNFINFEPDSVEWSSDNSDIVAILESDETSAEIIAISDGETSIVCTAHVGDRTISGKTNVTVANVSGVYVATTEIAAGEEYLITAELNEETYLLSDEVITYTFNQYIGEYDYLVGKKISVSSLKDYTGEESEAACTFRMHDGTAIKKNYRWIFDEVPTEINSSTIRNAASGNYLARLTGGNYSDLIVRNESNEVALRWYYENGGLKARSHINNPFAYITINDAEIPYFSSGLGISLTSNNPAQIKLYKRVEYTFHTVSFGCNGTLIKEIVLDGTILDEIDLSELCIPDGYMFCGWAKDGVILPSGYIINERTELTACYTRKSQTDELHTVTLNANSGVVEPSVLSQNTTGESFVLPLPVHERLEFSYWFDGTHRYAAGANYIPQSDVELIAVWEADTDCNHSFEGGACSICGAFLIGDADCNGDIDAADAAVILRHTVNLVKIQTLIGKINADTTFDNEIGAVDAAQVLRYVVLLITSFEG